MIYGVGVDLVRIHRFSSLMERFGERAVKKLLGPEEQMDYYCRAQRNPVQGVYYIGKRYAAKEAFAKALRLGIRFPITWHTLQILNDAQGMPYIVTTGALSHYMKEKCLSAQISLTDEVDAVLAFVVIEILP